MAINVSINPDLENFVMKEVENGRFASPSDVINESLEMMRARKILKTYTREEIVARLEESEKQIARGEGIEASKAFTDIRSEILSRPK